jgi:hypothetical protein
MLKTGSPDMDVSRHRSTIFSQTNPSIDVTSSANLEDLIKKLIEDFNSTISTSKFSSEENRTFRIAIGLLKKVSTTDQSIETQFYETAAITLGALILAMAYSDDRYGKQQTFGNQLLFPSKKLVEIEAIAGIKRFVDPLDQQILAVGKKALSKEIGIQDLHKILFPKALFPQTNTNLMLKHYLLESSIPLEEDAKNNHKMTRLPSISA